jgi:hypothetical protein
MPRRWRDPLHRNAALTRSTSGSRGVSSTARLGAFAGQHCPAYRNFRKHQWPTSIRSVTECFHGEEPFRTLICYIGQAMDVSPGIKVFAARGHRVARNTELAPIDSRSSGEGHPTLSLIKLPTIGRHDGRRGCFYPTTGAIMDDVRRAKILVRALERYRCRFRRFGSRKTENSKADHQKKLRRVASPNISGTPWNTFKKLLTRFSVPPAMTTTSLVRRIPLLERLYLS